MEIEPGVANLFRRQRCELLGPAAAARPFGKQCFNPDEGHAASGQSVILVDIVVVYISYIPLKTWRKPNSFHRVYQVEFETGMRVIPGTRALRTLAAAGKCLNFTRAAEELGLTPAAVSHQVKELEDQLDLTLFARTNRTVRLTKAGELMVEAANDALDLLARAAGRARRIERETSLLRLTVGPPSHRAG